MQVLTSGSYGTNIGLSVNNYFREKIEPIYEPIELHFERHLFYYFIFTVQMFDKFRLYNDQ